VEGTPWRRRDRGSVAPQAADPERRHDVEDAVQKRPDPGEHEQQVDLLDEELTARPERHREHIGERHTWICIGAPLIAGTTMDRETSRSRQT
jgi:hypothetical protein